MFMVGNMRSAAGAALKFNAWSLASDPHIFALIARLERDHALNGSNYFCLGAAFHFEDEQGFEAGQTAAFP